MDCELTSAVHATDILPETNRLNIDRRQMVRAELMGRHSHRTINGLEVHIWRRASKFLARGSIRKNRFGETLGSEIREAESRLRRILSEIEQGTYQTPSETRQRPLKHGPIPRMDFRQMVDRYLSAVRALRGKKTAADYRSRLIPVIEYCETKEIRSRWPWIIDIDSNLEFALGLKSFLFNRSISRNGHPAARLHRMSARQIYNVMSTVATVLSQVKRPEMNLLPSTFTNPFTRALIGDRPRRDPLSPPMLPMDLRIRLVKQMDAWQLCTLSWALVLPNRPDEMAGILISDVLRDRCEIMFASRWGGDDHNKARQSFRISYPVQFEPLLDRLIDGRAAGPLFRRRSIADSSRHPRLAVDSAAQVESEFDATLARLPRREVQSDQDRKRVFRRLLLDMGGVSQDDLGGEFRRVLGSVAPGMKVRFYDSRGSVITDLRRSGVQEILRRYVSGHSVRRDIMADYESQDLHADMDRYFNFIEPLLTAIADRATELGIQ